MISRKKSKQLIHSYLIVPSIGMFILLIGSVLFAGSGGDGGTGLWRDDDGTDILVTTADTGLTISEMGHEATLNISLTRAPTENVSIGLNVDDASEAELVTASPLVFSPSNWSIPHQIIVRGINDDIIDGDQPVNLVLEPASSTDLTFNGQDPRTSP